LELIQKIHRHIRIEIIDRVVALPVLPEFDHALEVLDRGHQQEVTVAHSPKSALVFGRELILQTRKSGGLRLEELIPQQVFGRPEQNARRRIRRDRLADRDPELPEVHEAHGACTELIIQLDVKPHIPPLYPVHLVVIHVAELR
jgi:hypothetical protein